MDMPGADYSILRPTPRDVRALAYLMYICKSRHIVHHMLFQNLPNQEIARRSYYQTFISNRLDETSHMAVNGQGDILGYVSFGRKYPPAPEQRLCNGDSDHDIPERESPSPDITNEAFSPTPEIDRDFQGMDRYELYSIFVVPSVRGCGIGRALMQKCFNKAVDEEVPIVSISEPEGLDFFLALGFTITRQVEIALARMTFPNEEPGRLKHTGVIWYP